jgi:hypothetical protein
VNGDTAGGWGRGWRHQGKIVEDFGRRGEECVVRIGGVARSVGSGEDEWEVGRTEWGAGSSQ